MSELTAERIEAAREKARKAITYMDYDGKWVETINATAIDRCLRLERAYGAWESHKADVCTDPRGCETMLEHNTELLAAVEDVEGR